jgi:hypothetical protein
MGIALNRNNIPVWLNGAKKNTDERANCICFIFSVGDRVQKRGFYSDDAKYSSIYGILTEDRKILRRYQRPIV